MKKLLLLLPVVFVLLVSGCTTQDPKEIVKEAIRKMEALDSYRASYDMSLEMYGFSLDGRMDIYNKGDKTRVDTIMNLMGQTTTTSGYTLPSGMYTCAEALGSVTCMKGDESQSMMSPEDSIMLNTEMIEKGVITLKLNNIATIIGRSCYNITSDFDISKLAELESEDLGNLGLEELLLGSLEAFTEFKIIQCYDFETGMPLTLSMVFELDMSKLPSEGLVMPESMSMVIDMTATSYEPNAVIADSVFELPAEPLDPSQICMDASTGLSMTNEEAREIALISDCVLNGTLSETYTCNSDTGTWWIDIQPDPPMEGCAPACVVDIVTGATEINWRCTGLITE